MISNPELVHYACIARKSTVLAEFAKFPDLETLARRCLERVPPHHSVYSHTVRSRSYTFLIDGPLVVFLIADEFLDQSECLWLLKRVKSAFEDGLRGWGLKRRPESLVAGCFQAELEALMREVMATAASVNSTPNVSSASLSNSLAFAPLLGGKLCKGLKKKKRLSGDLAKDSSTIENAVDVHDDGSREFSSSMPPQKSAALSFPGDRQKAKQVWRKHVWVVLLLDLFVCVVLFGIWLWVCRGFKCIEN